jgi:3-oxoacyl-[acyl-carrier protein] reductase
MAGVRGRTALVTGAGSPDGIGFATAKLLAEAGARVAITSTTERIFDRLKALPGGRRQKAAFTADLTDGRAVAALVKAVEKALGPVDILVNNAGMAQTGIAEPASEFQEITEAAWRRTLDLNLNTCFLVTRAVLPGMRKRGYGRIVNISSVSGPLVVFPRGAGYAAAKAAMLGLTRGLAIEVAKRGITVNAVAPGWIKTASSGAWEVSAGKNTPVGRPGRAEEVGHLARFLASEEASYITGQLIVVDGGNTIQEVKGPVD